MTRKIKSMMPIMLAALVLYGFGNGSEHLKAEKMNQVASVFSTSLAFSVDKPTGKTVIKVLDRETNEIIRQIPPEEMLRLIGKMRYVMGMLLDVEI